MKKILVPVGTSEAAKGTLQYAIDFASAFDAEVFAMQVFSASTGAGNLANVSDKLAATSKQRVKDLIEEVDTKQVQVSIATYKGDLVDGIKEVATELEIDLIIIAPKSNDIREGLYLGQTTGRIVKRTDVPTLIIPRETTFSPLKNVLMAFKSGILKKRRILNPLQSIQAAFDPTINLLFVKTPGYKEEDLIIHPALMDLSSLITFSENPTTYQGVLEHLQSKQPDLLVVFRRKRGFFTNLWEKNTILKSEFTSRIPVLVLSVKKD
ncbi:MAG: universal stress protein [Eudoraea sp.]|nr:universal stress protein [Eudoraea sp.]